MATEIEFPKAKDNALSRPQGKQFLTWLITKLTEIAMAQQATVDKETLKYFSASLAIYEPCDLVPALAHFCHRERETGETAFPSLPMIERAVIEARNKRWIAERKEEERLQMAIRAKHMQEHPEEYVSAGEFIHNCLVKFNAAKAAKQKSPWDSLNEAGALTEKQKAELAEILKNRETR